MIPDSGRGLQQTSVPNGGYGVGRRAEVHQTTSDSPRTHASSRAHAASETWRSNARHTRGPEESPWKCLDEWATTVISEAAATAAWSRFSTIQAGGMGFADVHVEHCERPDETAGVLRVSGRRQGRLGGTGQWAVPAVPISNFDRPVGWLPWQGEGPPSAPPSSR